MRISELLISMANDLENNPSNEVLELAEYNDDCLAEVALALVSAAGELRKAAAIVEELEPKEENKLSAEKIDTVANLAKALDQSGDLELQKTANVLDELLITISADIDTVKQLKSLQDSRSETLNKKYHSVNKELDKLNKITEMKEEIESSGYLEPHKIHSGLLSQRNCPDHPGNVLIRCGEDEWECSLDHKKYNWKEGFKLLNGDQIPGGDVANQTTTQNIPYQSAYYDDRSSRLNSNN